MGVHRRAHPHPFPYALAAARAPTMWHLAANRWSTNPTDCSGTWPTQLYVEDTVVIPADISPGEYVLGFRWDCEETTQIWQSCSDITIE